MNTIVNILIGGGALMAGMIIVALILNWIERPDPPYDDDEEEDAEYYFFHHKDRD